MVYTIGFGKRNSPDVLTVMERNTAKEALELAEALERRDEEIGFIDTPTDGRVGMNAAGLRSRVVGQTIRIYAEKLRVEMERRQLRFSPIDWHTPQ
jgi:hypothetical protein